MGVDWRLDPDRLEQNPHIAFTKVKVVFFHTNHETILTSLPNTALHVIHPDTIVLLFFLLRLRYQNECLVTS